MHSVVKKIIEHGMPEGADILNINVPAKLKSNKIKQTDLASKMYDTDVEKRIDPYGHPYYWIVGGLLQDDNKDSDVYVLRTENHPTITALSTDMTKKIDLSKWLE